MNHIPMSFESAVIFISVGMFIAGLIIGFCAGFASHDFPPTKGARDA